MNVSVAAEGVALKSGRVVVAFPSQSLVTAGGEIFISGGAADGVQRRAVDIMFRSAAQALGPRVIGVVLSGSLDDGSAGLVDIRARGGVAIVQEPADALHADMPGNAIVASAPEHILPVAAIPALLTRLLGEKLGAEPEAEPVPPGGTKEPAGHEAVGRAPAEQAPTTSGDANVTSDRLLPAQADHEAFERLLVHIKESRGFDFTGYKRSSLMRRLDLRMKAVRIEEFDAYGDFLETMNEELQSMNDELHSSNDELRSRTSEVGELNNVMESVLTAMRAGVMVVDRDLRIQVWNVRSEDLWGARQEEVVGQHLLNLDIGNGIEVDRLKPLVRQALSSGEEPKPVQLQAVNRRGRAITVNVAVTSMRSGDEEPTGALIVISEVG